MFFLPFAVDIGMRRWPIGNMNFPWTFGNAVCVALGTWRYGVIEVSGFWLVLLWLTFGIIGASQGGSDVGCWAHIGGCVVGVGVGFLLDAPR